jgi:uncharacterized protein DUF2281
MTKKSLLKQANQKLEQLTPDKIIEVMDFAEFLLAKTETSLHNDTLLKMAATSSTFSFVNEDTVEYLRSDIKSKK